MADEKPPICNYNDCDGCIWVCIVLVCLFVTCNKLDGIAQAIKDQTKQAEKGRP